MSFLCLRGTGLPWQACTFRWQLWRLLLLGLRLCSRGGSSWLLWHCRRGRLARGQLHISDRKGEPLQHLSLPQVPQISVQVLSEVPGRPGLQGTAKVSRDSDSAGHNCRTPKCPEHPWGASLESSHCEGAASCQ